MKTIMTIIFAVIVLFNIFMVTPFGAMWTFKSLDEGKPCYGILITFGTSIPLMIIGYYLGIIK